VELELAKRCVPKKLRKIFFLALNLLLFLFFVFLMQKKKKKKFLKIKIPIFKPSYDFSYWFFFNSSDFLFSYVLLVLFLLLYSSSFYFIFFFLILSYFFNSLHLLLLCFFSFKTNRSFVSLSSFCFAHLLSFFLWILDSNWWIIKSTCENDHDEIKTTPMQKHLGPHESPNMWSGVVSCYCGVCRK